MGHDFLSLLNLCYLLNSFHTDNTAFHFSLTWEVFLFCFVLLLSLVCQVLHYSYAHCHVKEDIWLHIFKIFLPLFYRRYLIFVASVDIFNGKTFKHILETQFKI